MQFQPHQVITIQRILDDPLDTGTYYVRAYVYKSSTNELLKTIDLIDNGGRRFSATYNAPDPDNNTYGMQIDITTRVFSDSGYTDNNNQYVDESQNHLIKKDNVNLGGGGGGYVDYSGIYKNLRKIIKEEISKIEKPQDLMSKFDAIHTGQMVLGRQIGSIKIPKTDLSDLKDKQDKIIKSISNIPETDLSPILDKMDNSFTELEKELDLKIKNDGKDNKDELNDILNKMQGLTDILKKAVIKDELSKYSELKKLIENKFGNILTITTKPYEKE